MTDTYKNFPDLRDSETEGTDYRVVCCDRKSPWCIAAPHAGKIEKGTSEITRAIAGEDLSFYLFEGIKSTGNQKLHITSTNFDEPRLLFMITNAKCIFGVHGMRDCHGGADAVWVGGLSSTAAKRVTENLKKTGFKATWRVADEKFAASSPCNICNRGKSGKGVQIEIARRLRDDLCNDDTKLNEFAAAIRDSLSE